MIIHPSELSQKNPLYVKWDGFGQLWWGCNCGWKSIERYLNFVGYHNINWRIGKFIVDGPHSKTMASFFDKASFNNAKTKIYELHKDEYDKIL